MKKSATSVELVKAHSTASLNPKVKCVVVADSEPNPIRRPSALSRHHKYLNFHYTTFISGTFLGCKTRINSLSVYKKHPYEKQLVKFQKNKKK